MMEAPKGAPEAERQALVDRKLEERLQQLEGLAALLEGGSADGGEADEVEAKEAKQQ